jgi:hypothetical protein
MTKMHGSIRPGNDRPGKQVWKRSVNVKTSALGLLAVTVVGIVGGRGLRIGWPGFFLSGAMISQVVAVAENGSKDSKDWDKNAAGSFARGLGVGVHVVDVVVCVTLWLIVSGCFGKPVGERTAHVVINIKIKVTLVVQAWFHRLVVVPSSPCAGRRVTIGFRVCIQDATAVELRLRQVKLVGLQRAGLHHDMIHDHV